MRFLMLLFAAIISLQLHAKIIEIGNFRNVLPHIDGETLLILDLDNTIMEPEDYLGSDQWFTALLSHFMENEKMGIHQALAIVVPKYNEAHKTATVKPVEQTTIEVISKLQNKNVAIMGMTARGDDCIPFALKQLKSINVDLEKTCVYKNRIPKLNLPHASEYKSGVLFCTCNSKGDALVEFLNEVKKSNPKFVNPKKIVFIDDKEKNVKAIEDAANKLGIKFTGIRYGFLDEKVKAVELTADMLAPFEIETAAAAASATT